ncbi:hypothetical protein BH10PLA2_BH10PLA2_30120 [soil metagenome]
MTACRQLSFDYCILSTSKLLTTDYRLLTTPPPGGRLP